MYLSDAIDTADDDIVLNITICYFCIAPGTTQNLFYSYLHWRSQCVLTNVTVSGHLTLDQGLSQVLVIIEELWYPPYSIDSEIWSTEQCISDIRRWVSWPKIKINDFKTGYNMMLIDIP